MQDADEEDEEDAHVEDADGTRKGTGVPARNAASARPRCLPNSRHIEEAYIQTGGFAAGRSLLQVHMAVLANVRSLQDTLSAAGKWGTAYGAAGPPPGRQPPSDDGIRQYLQDLDEAVTAQRPLFLVATHTSRFLGIPMAGEIRPGMDLPRPLVRLATAHLLTNRRSAPSLRRYGTELQWQLFPDILGPTALEQLRPAGAVPSPREAVVREDLRDASRVPAHRPEVVSPRWVASWYRGRARRESSNGREAILRLVHMQDLRRLALPPREQEEEISSAMRRTPPLVDGSGQMPAGVFSETPDGRLVRCALGQTFDHTAWSSPCRTKSALKTIAMVMSTMNRFVSAALALGHTTVEATMTIGGSVAWMSQPALGDRPTADSISPARAAWAHWLRGTDRSAATVNVQTARAYLASLMRYVRILRQTIGRLRLPSTDRLRAQLAEAEGRTPARGRRARARDVASSREIVAALDEAYEDLAAIRRGYPNTAALRQRHLRARQSETALQFPRQALGNAYNAVLRTCRELLDGLERRGGTVVGLLEAEVGAGASPGSYRVPRRDFVHCQAFILTAAFLNFRCIMRLQLLRLGWYMDLVGPNPDATGPADAYRINMRLMLTKHALLASRPQPLVAYMPLSRELHDILRRWHTLTAPRNDNSQPMFFNFRRGSLDCGRRDWLRSDQALALLRYALRHRPVWQELRLWELPAENNGATFPRAPPSLREWGLRFTSDGGEVADNGGGRHRHVRRFNVADMRRAGFTTYYLTWLRTGQPFPYIYRSREFMNRLADLGDTSVEMLRTHYILCVMRDRVQVWVSFPQPSRRRRRPSRRGTAQSAGTRMNEHENEHEHEHENEHERA